MDLERNLTTFPPVILLIPIPKRKQLGPPVTHFNFSIVSGVVLAFIQRIKTGGGGGGKRNILRIVRWGNKEKTKAPFRCLLLNMSIICRYLWTSKYTDRRET